LGIHRSTLAREWKRDEGVRERLERALTAGRTARESAARRVAFESRAVPARLVMEPRADPVAAEAPPVQRDRTGEIRVGAGRVVFGSRRPQPLARVRRIALHGAQPATSGPSAPGPERLILRDWLPAVLLLTANVALAWFASSNIVVVAVVVLVAAAYLALIRWLSRPRLASPLAGTRIPPPGSVRKDLAWLHTTIGEPALGERRPRPPKGRTDG
jgi:hypothetical protein